MDEDPQAEFLVRGAIVPGHGRQLPVEVRQFALTLPDELLDAARMDGAGEFTILWRIAVPMQRPAVATLPVVLVFIDLRRKTPCFSDGDISRMAISVCTARQIAVNVL